MTLTGNMQGFEVVKFEYSRDGQDFFPVGIIMNTGGRVTIQPAVPGQPEVGQLRGIFLKKGEPYGNYSDYIPVTVS